MPLDRYFVPELIIPYLATRGCYWGRCTFCDHGQGYFDQYRGIPAQLVIDQIKVLRDKYQCRHFLFSDESYPPALFKKVSQLLVDQNVGIKWTTLIRFEETLQDQTTWDLAAQAGCCTLYYGMESANERVLNLYGTNTLGKVSLSGTSRWHPSLGSGTMSWRFTDFREKNVRRSDGNPAIRP